jgi:hypothetical protein
MFYKVTLQALSNKGNSCSIEICPEANNEEEAESKARMKVFKEINDYLNYHDCEEIVGLENIKVEKLHD